MTWLHGLRFAYLVGLVVVASGLIARAFTHDE
jgi:hypothetical protein